MSVAQKVLFFIEPFPVRDRPGDFQWIWEKWAKLVPHLQAHGVACVFACSDYMKQHNAEVCPTVAPADFGVRATSTADSEWVALMSRSEHPVWGPFVERLLDTTAPTVIVTWTVNRPLQAAAAARGIPILHAELGPIRFPWGNFYFADPAGVNGASSMPAIWPALRDVPLSPGQEHELDTFVSELVRGCLGQGRAADVAKACRLDPAKKTVGVFLQVPRDSNVLLWARVADNVDLMRRVTERFPPSHYQYLIKVHPQDPQPRGLEAFADRIAPHAAAQDVIDLCDAVVTINSSIVVEALAAEKPVYTFGASPYELEGCTRDAASEEVGGPLAPLTLEERTLSRRLLHFLFFRYFAWEEDLDDPAIFHARLERFRAWYDAGGDLLAWFVEPRDAKRLLELRARRRAAELLAATKALEVFKAEGEVLAQRLAGAENDARQAHERNRGLEAGMQELRLQQSALSAEKDAIAAELATTRAHNEQLEHSLPIRAGNVLRRIPLVTPVVRLARRVKPKR